MQALDLNVLTLIIGLSVYVSSIRFVIVGRLLADPPPSGEKKKSYKNFLKWLIPADAAFLIAGVALFLILFWGHLFGAKAPGWLSLVVVWAFAAGIAALVAHHLVSYFRTLRGS